MMKLFFSTPTGTSLAFANRGCSCTTPPGNPPPTAHRPFCDLFAPTQKKAHHASHCKELEAWASPTSICLVPGHSTMLNRFPRSCSNNPISMSEVPIGTTQPAVDLKRGPRWRGLANLGCVCEICAPVDVRSAVLAWRRVYRAGHETDGIGYPLVWLYAFASPCAARRFALEPR